MTASSQVSLSEHPTFLVIDTRTGGDWSLDLMFAGLVKNLGFGRVLDCPFKTKHREWDAPRQAHPDWGLERRTLGHTIQNGLIPGFDPGDSQMEGYVRWLAQNRSLVVITDERDESHEVYFKLGLGHMGVPVVVVAGHDRFWNVSPQHVQQRFGGRLLALFIDNWLPEYSNLQRTHLINWSANFDHYWERPEVPPEKEFDIFFLGYNSHPDRARFIDFIRSEFRDLNNRIYLERRPDTLDAYRPKSEYFDEMARSKICLNLRGAAQGGKTLRFLEIPYVGSLMVSQLFSDRQLHPFNHNEHCMYFSTEEQLANCIVTSLADPAGSAEIARAGHEHLMKFHTVESRVRYVLDTIGVS